MKLTQEEALIFDALSAVETPPCDLAGGIRQRQSVKQKPLRIYPPRRVLALAAVCLALVLAVGAAAAVGISGLWREFLGDTVPSYAVTTVGVSQTAGDYVLTVEDAMVDSRSVLLLLSLRRTDGGQMDPEAHLETNSMHPNLAVVGEDYSGGASGFLDGTLSADGTTISYLYQKEVFDDTADLIGKQLTFTADGVAIQLREADGYYQIRGQFPVSLAPLAGVAVPDLSALPLREPEDRAKLAEAILPAAEQLSIPLPMDDTFPQFRIRGAVVTEDGLSVVITGSGSTSGDLVCTGVDVEALVDTRDGTRYGISGGPGLKLKDGTYAYIPAFRDCPLSPDELQYCTLEVSYALDQVLSTAPFSLSFPAQDTGSARKLPLEDTVTVEGVTLHPDELRLSPLGVSMHFLDSMDTIDILYTSGVAPVLHLSDGSTIQTRWSGGYDGHDGVCSVGFGANDEAGARIFFDVTQIVSITFGDLEIPLS